MSRKWEEEAAYYEAHRDDPEEWGDPIEAPIVAPKSGLAISVTVRFSPEDAEAIRATARLENKTYSEVVRTAVQRYTQPDAIRPTGGMIRLSGLQGDNPVTQPDKVPRAVGGGNWPIGTQTASSMTMAVD